MPQRQRAAQTLHPLALRQAVADKPQGALDAKVTTVVRNDAATVLTAMLQRMQAQHRLLGSVLAADDAKDAARLAQNIPLPIPIPLQSRRGRSHEFALTTSAAPPTAPRA